MLTAMWAVKGGQGVSVTAALLAKKAASRDTPVLLVDLCGDQTAIFDASETAHGVGDWAASDLSMRSLDRHKIELAPNLFLLPKGRAPLTGRRASELAEHLASSEGTVVVDAGALGTGDAGADAFRQAFVDRADESVLVTRKCYLALSRPKLLPAQPTRMALLSEPGRSLPRSECERAIKAPVAAEIEYDPEVARAVDAGMLHTRDPEKALDSLAELARLASPPPVSEQPAHQGAKTSQPPVPAQPAAAVERVGPIAPAVPASAVSSNRAGSKRAKILAAARANPKLSAEQIARATGAAPGYTASVLKQAGR